MQVKIIQVSDIPQTLNGKKVEVPVKKVGYLRTKCFLTNGDCLDH